MFAGGIYVQEPDAGAAAVDALAALAADHPLLLPLGFAYGELQSVWSTESEVLLEAALPP